MSIVERTPIGRSPVDHDQMRGVVLGHQLGSALERLARRHGHNRRRRRPAGGLLVEIADRRGGDEVEVGDDSPGRPGFAATALDDDAVDVLARHRRGDLRQQRLAFAREDAAVHASLTRSASIAADGVGLHLVLHRDPFDTTHDREERGGIGIAPDSACGELLRLPALFASLLCGRRIRMRASTATA